MSQKSVYRKNNGRCRVDNKKDSDEQVFDYLLKHKENFFTRTAIAKALGVSLSTVSRCIDVLYNERDRNGTITGKRRKYTNGNSEYELVESEGKIAISNREEFIRKYLNQYAVGELGKAKAWTSELVEEINSYVLLFKINSKYKKHFKKYLKAKYRDIIATLVLDENVYKDNNNEQNLYIILKVPKTSSDEQKFNVQKEELLNFYQNNVIEE